MANEIAKPNNTSLSPSQRIKQVLGIKSVQEMIVQAADKHADQFAASIIEVFGSTSSLHKCDPALVVKEALKAATLNLPLNKALGFSWIVSYNQKIKGENGEKDRWEQIPNFQIGWKGYVQLAQRTGMYKFINAGLVLEGEYVGKSRLTGEVDIEGTAVSDKIVGYFAYIEMTYGFKKALYWEKDTIVAHAIKYNPANRKAGNLVGIWQSDFDAMAIKTVLSSLIRGYGYMSTEMLTAIKDESSAEDRVNSEISENANTGSIGFTSAEVVDEKTGEVKKIEAGQDAQGEGSSVNSDGPDFG
jgi:recombination protein RecT